MESSKMSKKEKSRHKIMHAAKGLFERDGIENVTFTQIAEEADVCRTTVFNHFAGTRELMLAISRQEIEDIKQYCSLHNMKGKTLVYGLYDKLIDDTVCYPVLTGKLINNAIINHQDDNPVKIIEEMTEEGLRTAGTERAEELAVLIEGAYFGLTNHYHINDKTFDGTIMKEEFHKLLDYILSREEI